MTLATRWGTAACSARLAAVTADSAQRRKPQPTLPCKYLPLTPHGALDVQDAEQLIWPALPEGHPPRVPMRLMPNDDVLVESALATHGISILPRLLARTHRRIGARKACVGWAGPLGQMEVVSWLGCGPN